MLSPLFKLEDPSWQDTKARLVTHRHNITALLVVLCRPQAKGGNSRERERERAGCKRLGQNDSEAALLESAGSSK